ncbi:hypothetical protein FIBSPDRAFT_960611 [Athelia psychrophila]|uniref:Uncharacterized protein n=1 Tax=Athelia psychrophila TaxID=1759441 RepID=A0A166C5W7_9AGAM|nr:hypothetical protein FIBSPDRAFT_960611 [Fibularhizoctonia sp. CBS 109695]
MQKHGGKEHFKGAKALWLVSRAALFQAAQDAGRTGEFYSFITREFIKEFGDDGSGDFTLEKDEHVGPDAPVKLSQWFRHRYKSVVSSTTTQGFSGLFGRDTWTAPKKRSALQTYTKQRYTSHIKSEYENRFAAARLEWDMASEVQRVQEKMENPVPVGFRAKVIYEFWKAETQDVREQMEQMAADEHMMALENWNNMKTAPMTPHQFHHQLHFVAQYVRPIADAIAAQMQASVSIQIVGPIPERNGEIKARSINVNWPGGLSTATWPMFDPLGFEAATQSLVGYARANFTTEECKRRALPETELEEMKLLDQIENASFATDTDVASTCIPSPHSTQPSTSLPSVSSTPHDTTNKTAAVPSPPAPITSENLSPPIPVVITPAAAIINAQIATSLANTTTPTANNTAEVLPVQNGRKLAQHMPKEQREESPLPPSRTPSPVSTSTDWPLTDQEDLRERCTTVLDDLWSLIQQPPSVTPAASSPPVVTTSSSPVEPTTSSPPFTPAVASHPVAPAVASCPAAPAVVSRPAAPAVVSRPAAPAVAYRPVAPAAPSPPVAPAALLPAPLPPVAPVRPRPRPVARGTSPKPRYTGLNGFGNRAMEIPFAQPPPPPPSANTSALPATPSLCAGRSASSWPVPEMSRWPSSVIETYEYLVGGTEEWGDTWLRCLGFFFQFLENEGFPESAGGNLEPMIELRPEVVQNWMRVPRRWADQAIVLGDF